MQAGIAELKRRGLSFSEEKALKYISEPYDETEETEEAFDCPKCGTLMQKGSLYLGDSLLGVMAAGLSVQNLYFSTRGNVDENKTVIRNFQLKPAHSCEPCQLFLFGAQ